MSQLRALLDHAQQALGDGVCLEAAQGAIEEQHREAVDGRPGEVLRAWAMLAGQGAGRRPEVADLRRGLALG